MIASRRRKVTYLIFTYLAIGFLLSFLQNLSGAIMGGPSALVWAGSVKNNAILLFWWFFIPALTWPIDLYWTLYHKIF
jgi:hypothetical protein